MLKTLIVEDDDSVQMLLVEIFKENNYITFKASNGKIGLELCREYKPDVILTDLLMPVMDGFSFIEAVRKFDKTTPIIVISGTSNDRHWDRAFNLGANVCYSKPIIQERLISTVKKIISNKEDCRFQG